jgi:hypothetical protein
VGQDSLGGFELGKRRAVIARVRDPGEGLGRCWNLVELSGVDQNAYGSRRRYLFGK